MNIIYIQKLKIKCLLFPQVDIDFGKYSGMLKCVNNITGDWDIDSTILLPYSA